MLNKAGRRAGIDERKLFTGRQSTVDKYASDELKEFFLKNPRPTRERMLGRTSETRYRANAAFWGEGPGDW